MSASVASAPRANRHTQVFDELRQQIVAGDLKPGDRLPSFTEMREQHGVSQSTLNRVHSALEGEGLIVRRRGAGTFVTDESRPYSNGASPKKTSFLNSAVVLLNEFARPSTTHQATGWLEWIGQSVFDAVQEQGRHVVSLHPDTAGRDVEQLVLERPAGVIVTALYMEKAHYCKSVAQLVEKFVVAKIPVVTFSNIAQSNLCDYVVSDHERGAYELTRLLVAQGRKRIVLTGTDNSKNSYDWFDQRYAGYQRALQEASLEVLPVVPLPFQRSLSGASNAATSPGVPNPDDVAAFDHNVKSSVGYFLEHLTGPNRADAIMMINDQSVFMMAAVCRMLGLDPNSDVLIAGYDNFFSECEERLIAPFTPFATVDKNNVQIGAALSRLLRERINDQLPPNPQCRCIAPTLVPLKV